MAEKIKNYVEMLTHPKWQRRRLEIMQRDNFACVKCGDEETTLNVHHKEYGWDKKPWEYPDEALETLCEKCHKREHSKPLAPEKVSAIFSEPLLFTDPKRIKEINIKRLSLQKDLKAAEMAKDFECVRQLLRAIMELDKEKISLRKFA